VEVLPLSKAGMTSC